MDFDTGRGRGGVREVAGDVLGDAVGTAGERVEQFRVDARDFLSARELGEAISTRIEGRTAALSDAAEIVNRSFPERDETGRFTNVISPVVMPNRRFSLDRKSTRLNSSHANISYAVFCLKKKHN